MTPMLQYIHNCIRTCIHTYVYKFIRDNGGFENWSMIEIERYSATDKKDLEKRERHYIETLQSTLNKSIPTRTKKEYKIANSEQIKEQNKEYRKDNVERTKQYRLDNIDEYKEIDKKRYEEKKELILEQAKLLYQTKKDVLATKITCECGKILSKSGLSAHKKTEKHQAYLQNLTTN